MPILRASCLLRKNGENGADTVELSSAQGRLSLKFKRIAGLGTQCFQLSQKKGRQMPTQQGVTDFVQRQFAWRRKKAGISIRSWSSFAS